MIELALGSVGEIPIDVAEFGADANVDAEVAEVGIGGRGGSCERLDKKLSEPLRCKPARLRIDEDDMLSRDEDFSGAGIFLSAAALSVQSDGSVRPPPSDADADRGPLTGRPYLV